MEYLEFDNSTYDSIQGFNDLDAVSDNLSLKKIGKGIKKAAKKVGKVALKVNPVAMSVKAVKTGAKVVKKVAPKVAKVAKKAAKATAKVAKKVAKVGGNIVKNVAGVTVLLPLQPLRPAMVKALKKKGVSVSSKTSLVDVATRFYKNVVKSNYDGVDELPDYDLYDMDEDSVAVAIPVIVEAIIAFFKKSKEKKERGEPLSKAEEMAAEGAEVAVSEIQENAKEEVAQEIGKKIMNPTTIIIIVAVVGIAIFLIMRNK